jgi:hypothetical protein
VRLAAPRAHSLRVDFGPVSSSERRATSPAGGPDRPFRSYRLVEGARDEQTDVFTVETDTLNTMLLCGWISGGGGPPGRLHIEPGLVGDPAGPETSPWPLQDEDAPRRSWSTTGTPNFRHLRRGTRVLRGMSIVLAPIRAPNPKRLLGTMGGCSGPSAWTGPSSSADDTSTASFALHRAR